MKVKELIEWLQTQPQDRVVAYRCFSEQCVMDLGDIRVLEAAPPRADGWIQNCRPDLPVQSYVLFPGN